MKKEMKISATASSQKPKQKKTKTDLSLSPPPSIFQYRKLYDNIMEGFAYVDMQGIIKESNSVYQKMLGYTASELMCLTYNDLTPAKWHEVEKKIVEEQILVNGFSEVYEKEYIRKNGTIFPVELRTCLVKNDAGENEGMWAFIRDITERKKKEEQLIENDYWLNESQRIGRLGYYTFDIKSNSYTCSTVLDSIFGIEKDSEKTIEAWNNLVVPEQREEMLSYFLNYVFLERQPFDKEYEIIRANDKERRWVWGHGELQFDEEGTPVIMFGIIQDINDRKKAEETLRRSEIEYRDTLNAVPDVVFVVDENLRLLTVNKSFREEYYRQGLLSECTGKKITSKISFIPGTTIQAIRNVFQSGTGLIISEKITFSDKPIYAEFRIIPFLKNQKVNSVITLIRDRSREVEIEELKLKNIEQKEVLLREIHHRVKNNLSIVISLLNFQLRKHTDPTLNRIIQDIQMRIRSMALIHEHLYFSETLDRIPLVSYISALTSFITASFKEQNVHMVSRLDPMDVRIETALPLGLIINELLTNAFKYAFPSLSNGEIRIDLVKTEDDLSTLIVKDNGVGLPETVSMESEKSLGLFIVRLLVEQLEGTIEIIRQNGTEFIIKFRNLLLGKQDT
jgi:PAS domain S-box-containing protein